MKQVRKCKYCGKEFVARNGMQKYCCEECQTKAKEARKKRQLDFMNAVEPVIDLQLQEYLTFAKAAILMGCSRQYVYKLVNEGKLAASRISSRMAFIRKADIEKMFQRQRKKRRVPRITRAIIWWMRCLITFPAKRSCVSTRSRSRGSIPQRSGTKYQYAGLLG